MTVLSSLRRGRPGAPEQPGWEADRPAAAFAFGIPDGWRPFDERELRRSSHDYGMRVLNGVVSETMPRRSEIVVLSTVGTSSPHSIWPPNGWPGHHPDLQLAAGPDLVSVGGEQAVLSRYVSDHVGVWGDDGWWTPSKRGDRERMTMIDVTTGHRGWLYKVLLMAPSDVAHEHEKGAYQTVLDSWQWDALPDSVSEGTTENRQDSREIGQSLLGVTAWNEQCSAFTFGIPVGWRNLTPRELERASPMKEERVWAGITLDDSDPGVKIEVTGHPGHLRRVVRGLIDEALAATSSVSLVDGPNALEIGGEPGASLHYVCLAYDHQTGTEAQSIDLELPDFFSVALLLAEWQGWVYRIRMYCPERDTPRHTTALSTVLRTWRWERT